MLPIINFQDYVNSREEEKIELESYLHYQQEAKM